MIFNRSQEFYTTNKTTKSSVMVTLCCNVKFSTRFLYFDKEEPCLTDKLVPRPFLGGAATTLYNFVNMKYHAPIFL
uniref:Uncharacterized protein n=1 Tax=Aegilops tauschii subsp. strangulata TaxID=200361 RepID=A0A452ZZQ1_AEGTS